MAAQAELLTWMPAREAPDEITPLLEDAQIPFSAAGRLWLKRGETLYSCADTPQGRELLRTIDGATAQETVPRSMEGSLKALLERGGKDAAEECVRRYGLRASRRRCVILFLRLEGASGPLAETLRELAPGAPGEMLVPLDGNRAAFLKDLQEDDYDEAEEFAGAVLEMAEGEAGLRLTAGIGRVREELVQLPESLREAEGALETGRRFGLSGPVFRHDQQMLERIMAAVPGESREKALKELFNERTEKALQGEMLETMECFLRNDLNLSTTARALFIHRNTLIYRLDRMKKMTGLDLRNFRDAAVFDLLLALKRLND